MVADNFLVAGTTAQSNAPTFTARQRALTLTCTRYSASIARNEIPSWGSAILSSCATPHQAGGSRNQRQLVGYSVGSMARHRAKLAHSTHCILSCNYTDKLTGEQRYDDGITTVKRRPYVEHQRQHAPTVSRQYIGSKASTKRSPCSHVHTRSRAP